MQLRRCIPALLFVISVFVAPVHGQSTDGETKIGVGVAFDGGTTVTVPIHLSSIRLEPQVGYRQISRSIEGEDDESSSLLEIGGGVFTPLQTYEGGSVYAGGRVGIVQQSQSTGNTTMSESGFFIGPALGGEYYLGDQFSLGAEAALYYRGIPTPANEDVSRSTISTNGRAFVRVYL
jgi:hypothetical protein